MALSHRDQLLIYADERCRYWHGFELGNKLHGGRDYPNRYPISTCNDPDPDPKLKDNRDRNAQWRFYIIWTIFNASFVPIVYLFFPETADRTLEDVDRLFRENQNVGSSFSLLSPLAVYWLT